MDRMRKKFDLPIEDEDMEFPENLEVEDGNGKKIKPGDVFHEVYEEVKFEFQQIKAK